MAAAVPLKQDTGELSEFLTGDFLPVANGGTGAITAAAACTALGAQATSTKDTSGGYPGLTFGTWTPTISFGTPGTSSFTYSSQFGQYVVIGNLVYVDFFITFTPTIGTGSGNIQIVGLPFTPGADLDSVGNVRSLTSTFVWPTNATMISLTVSAAGLGMNAMGPTINSVAMKATNLTGGSAHTIGGTIVYRK